MGGGVQEGGDEELITAINVTPLVDIVLVLLIILMVTATAIVSKTIPMELPEAATGEPTQSTTLAISLDENGVLYLDGNELEGGEAELREKVEQAVGSQDEVRAVIAAAGSLTHARVVRIIDLLRQEQVTKFAINVKPSELAE